MKRANLFLLELVLALLLFAVCATVCVGLVLYAKGLSRESRMLTEAVAIAQDAAERYRADLEPTEYYTAAGTPVETADDADYTVAWTEDPSRKATVSVYALDDDAAPIYELTVAKGVAAP